MNGCQRDGGCAFCQAVDATGDLYHPGPDHQLAIDCCVAPRDVTLHIEMEQVGRIQGQLEQSRKLSMSQTCCSVTQEGGGSTDTCL